VFNEFHRHVVIAYCTGLLHRSEWHVRKSNQLNINSGKIEQLGC